MEREPLPEVYQQQRRQQQAEQAQQELTIELERARQFNRQIDLEVAKQLHDAVILEDDPLFDVPPVE